MRRNGFFRRLLAVLLRAGLIVGLAAMGSQLYGLAVLCVPLIVMLTWRMVVKSSRLQMIITLLILFAAFWNFLTPLQGKFFSAAVGCGILMPWFAKRRPEEDDWFYIVPLLLLGLMALLTAIDAMARPHGVMLEYVHAFNNMVRKGQALNQQALGSRHMLEDDFARWIQGQTLLGWRIIGVCGSAALALMCYLMIGPVRRAQEPIRLPGEGFVRFQTKQIYLLLFVAGEAALIIWHYQPIALWGCIGYGLIFLVGMGFLLQTIALGAWFLWRAEIMFPITIAALAVTGAVVAAPILAAPLAMLGLADIWLDFRRLG